MTRPADRFVAAAFWEVSHNEDFIGRAYGGVHPGVAKAAAISLRFAILERAKELEAEAGGADRQTEEVMRNDRGSPEDDQRRAVASAAECETAARYQCPRCPALMPPGKFCKGNPPDDPCPMRSV